MKLVFRIDLFIEYLRKHVASERDIQRVLDYKDWGKYDGMTYDEVRHHEVYLLKEWFTQEEKS